MLTPNPSCVHSPSLLPLWLPPPTPTLTCHGVKVHDARLSGLPLLAHVAGVADDGKTPVQACMEGQQVL